MRELDGVVAYLPLGVKAQLDRLARSTSRSRSQMIAFLIERAIEESINENSTQPDRSDQEKLN